MTTLGFKTLQLEVHSNGKNNEFNTELLIQLNYYFSSRIAFIFNQYFFPFFFYTDIRITAVTKLFQWKASHFNNAIKRFVLTMHLKPNERICLTKNRCFFSKFYLLNKLILKMHLKKVNSNQWHLVTWFRGSNSSQALALKKMI